MNKKSVKHLQKNWPQAMCTKKHPFGVTYWPRLPVEVKKSCPENAHFRSFSRFLIVFHTQTILGKKAGISKTGAEKRSVEKIV